MPPVFQLPVDQQPRASSEVVVRGVDQTNRADKSGVRIGMHTQVECAGGQNSDVERTKLTGYFSEVARFSCLKQTLKIADFRTLNHHTLESARSA